MDDSSNGPVRLGEVIETTSIRFWVESDVLHQTPPLGSVVRVSSIAGDLIYAVVAYAETTGIDSSRRAIRRGSDEIRDEAVYRRHPELSRILRTVFEAVPVAFRRNGRLICMLPPLPPTLHYSVEVPNTNEMNELTHDLKYLTQLTRYSGDVSQEQLVAAHIRYIYEANGEDLYWIEAVSRELARLYKNDYETLLPLLESLAPDN